MLTLYRLIKNFAFYLWFLSFIQLLLELTYSLLNKKFHIRTFKEIGTSLDKSSFDTLRTFVEPFLTPAGWKIAADLPFCLIIFGFGIFFYIFFRLLCLVSGRKASEFTFRNAHLAALRKKRGQI